MRAEELGNENLQVCGTGLGLRDTRLGVVTAGDRLDLVELDQGAGRGLRRMGIPLVQLGLDEVVDLLDVLPDLHGVDALSGLSDILELDPEVRIVHMLPDRVVVQVQAVGDLALGDPSGEQGLDLGELLPGQRGRYGSNSSMSASRLVRACSRESGIPAPLSRKRVS